MTAVVETSMLQQPPTLTSTWASEISEWEASESGKSWRCQLTGQHHGARVRQYVTARWLAERWVVRHSSLFIIERGPSCPSWCAVHASQGDPYEPGLETDYVDHQRRVRVGDIAVEVDAVEDPETGQFDEVSITPPDRVHGMDAITARDLAAALVQAAELLEGGEL